MPAPYYGYRATQWLSLCLPTGVAFPVAERLADAWARVSSRNRAAVQANLSLVLARPVGPREPVVREVFRNFGRYLVEFFTSQRIDRLALQVQGEAHLAQAWRPNRGAIILTGHLGNWELGAVVLQRMGWPVSVVVLPHADPRMDRLFNQQRRRSGLEVIPLGPEAARRSLTALKSGRLLGLVGDQEFSNNGVPVSVGGHEFVLPRGPAMLCLRSQAPLVPTFLIREGRQAFRLYIEPPIDPPTACQNETAVRTMTARYAAVLTDYLTRFPAQWLLFQPVLARPDGPRLSSVAQDAGSAGRESE